MNANQPCSTFMYFPYKRIAVKESLRGGLPGLLRSFFLLPGHAAKRLFCCVRSACCKSVVLLSRRHAAKQLFCCPGSLLQSGRPAVPAAGSGKMI